MEYSKIWDDDKKGFYTIFNQSKIEKITPLELKKNITEVKAIMLKELLSVKNPTLASSVKSNFYINKAEELLKEHWEKIDNSPVEPNILKVLETTKKKKQEKLLKGQTITPDQLNNLIFRAYDDYGYLYSRYTYEIPSKGIDMSKVPKIIHVKDNGGIDKVGDTELTDGQLKNVVDHRKVVVAHFFEKENVWHCFFTTFNSLKGKENWKDGQAHLHYISNAYNLTKEECLKNMESGNYKSTSVHIDLLDYGYQAK